MTDDHGTSYIKYFQTKRVNKRERIVTAKNGDLAKIFRLTIGIDAGDRLRNSMIMARALIGCQFLCATEVRTDQKTGEISFKVKNLQPVEPIITDQWTATGQLKKQKRASKIEPKANPKLTQSLPVFNPDLTQSLPVFNPNLTRSNTTTTRINTRSRELFQSDKRCQILDEQIQDEQVLGLNPSITQIPQDNQYMVMNESGGFDFYRMPNETTEQIYDRVIDETF